MLVVLARAGLAHADLSAYNLLVHRDRLVMIDLPQVVDVIANPQGPAFLDRDAGNVAAWFAARGLPGADPQALVELLRAEAGLGPVP
jgi:RIO kinase 1